MLTSTSGPSFGYAFNLPWTHQGSRTQPTFVFDLGPCGYYFQDQEAMNTTYRDMLVETSVHSDNHFRKSTTQPFTKPLSLCVWIAPAGAQSRSMIRQTMEEVQS
jgi:hypothetical protein